MTKHPHHHAYPEGSTDFAVAALLTVWSSLRDYESDVVLVGGLVPKFLCDHSDLCDQSVRGRPFPRPQA